MTEYDPPPAFRGEGTGTVVWKLPQQLASPRYIGDYSWLESSDGTPLLLCVPTVCGISPALSRPSIVQTSLTTRATKARHSRRQKDPLLGKGSGRSVSDSPGVVQTAIFPTRQGVQDVNLPAQSPDTSDTACVDALPHPRMGGHHPNTTDRCPVPPSEFAFRVED